MLGHRWGSYDRPGAVEQRVRADDGCVDQDRRRPRATIQHAVLSLQKRRAVHSVPARSQELITDVKYKLQALHSA